MRAHACVVLISALAFNGLACAQAYPSKPIRIIDAYAPGGSSDIMARIIGQRMTENWGQQVVVDNRPGGNAVIGTDLAAKAPADGYTLLMFTSTLTVQPSLYKNLPYDLRTDFAPVALVATTSNVLLVNSAAPAASLKEFVALAKARSEGAAVEPGRGAGRRNARRIPVVHPVRDREVGTRRQIFRHGIAGVVTEATQ